MALRYPFGTTAGALVLAVALANADQDHASDPWSLNAAVRIGQSMEVQPYQLRGSVDGKRLVGAVYTPFVRTARYVWRERRQDKDVAIESLPDEVTRPVLHVVMEAYPPNSSNDMQTLMAAINRPATAVAAGEGSYFMPFGNRMPPPIEMSSAHSLEAMVGKIAIEGAVLVGVFSAEFAHRHVLEFCVYQGHDDGSYHVISGFVAGPVR